MNNYMILGLIFLIYIIGFIISLIYLVKYGEKNGHGGYDPPHGTWYDSYESNSSAFLWFSIIWPLYYFGTLIFFGYGKLLSLSDYLNRSNKE